MKWIGAAYIPYPIFFKVDGLVARLKQKSKSTWWNVRRPRRCEPEGETHRQRRGVSGVIFPECYFFCSFTSDGKEMLKMQRYISLQEWSPWLLVRKPATDQRNPGTFKDDLSQLFVSRLLKRIRDSFAGRTGGWWIILPVLSKWPQKKLSSAAFDGRKITPSLQTSFLPCLLMAVSIYEHAQQQGKILSGAAHRLVNLIDFVAGHFHHITDRCHASVLEYDLPDVF